jgi:flagellum-specific ATP synthase
MPLGDMQGLHVGCEVVASEHPPLPLPGPELLGRVLDSLGRPFDGLGLLPVDRSASTAPAAAPPEAPADPRARFPRACARSTPSSRSARASVSGLFSGSGVGKSTLLGMIARNCAADVIVVALVGERGSEVREFIEKDLGSEGLKRSVVVVATSDTPAPLRLRAAFTATALAERFRDEGKNVLLMMDSVTRFAMAQREIGLAIGEPPQRGATRRPSSRSCRGSLERSGAGENGSITAIYTVLVEGDDTNEPVTDTVRGIVDGHIMLSRSLANSNHYPAIDVLESVSRLSRDICEPEEIELAGRAREHMAVYRKNEDLIAIGAYQKGSTPAIDQAIALQAPLRQFLRQGVREQTPRTDAFSQLKGIL